MMSDLKSSVWQVLLKNLLKKKSLTVIILLVAFALRVVALDQTPPGLSHDEAYNGVTAMQVLAGQRLIFFEINKGIEPLIIYLEALAFYAFGIGPVSMRLVNVICGMLTVALIYPLAVRLFNRPVALLAMVSLAVSFWAIFTSRLALRAVTLPPLLILTIYLLWCGLESKVKPHVSGIRGQGLWDNASSPIPILLFFALSGLAAGASMYTYLSSRFVPVLIVAIFGYQLFRRKVTIWHWLGLFLLLLIWAIILAPLATYFLQHAASFTERSSQVSTIPYALNGDFGPLARNTWRTLAMFTFHGDETARYNLDGRPVFDWVNGLLFYAGLVIVLLRLRRSSTLAAPAALLLLWLWVMLLPGFITDDSPHFLRTIGAMPVVYLLWALGVEAAVQKLKEWANGEWRIPAFHISGRTPPIPHLILLLVFLTTLHTIYDYFGRWTADPEARYIYGADMAEVARYVNASRDEGLVAISAEYYRDLDPFRFMLHSHGQPPFAIWFDGRQTLAFPPPRSGLSPRYIFPASAPPTEVWQPFLQPSTAESGREYTVYHLVDTISLHHAQTAAFSPDNTLGVNINNALILSAYQVLGTVVSGGKFQVLLKWQALRALPPGTDYTFLVRLHDSQGHIWATTDGNGYPPDNWQPGVQGLQLLALRLPGDLPPQTYHLTVQVVDRHSGQSLPTATGDTAILLGTLPGQLAQTPRLIDPTTLPNPGQTTPVTGPGRDISLRGYEVKNRTTRPGEALTVTLHWQVLQQPRQNYRLKFFLVNEADSAGEIVYHWPALPPVNGEWPTSRWPAHYWVQDRISLPLTPDIPLGQVKLRMNWVDENTPQDWAVAADDTFVGFELGLITIGR